MTRPLRIEYPGALFHISARGNARQNIFFDDIDRETFLTLLGKSVKHFDWILSTYCLMTNHYHLVVKLTCETMSRGLRWLDGQYAAFFNRRHKRVGHLFQGRPDLQLVEEDAYFNNVVRYVVLNPVRAQMVARPEDFAWSSHRAVIGLTDAPSWLAVDDVLAQFATDRDTARARYRAFVNAGIGVENEVWKELVGQQYLGRKEWLAEVQKKIELRPRVDDHPRQQRVLLAPAMAQIVSVVARSLDLTESDVRSHRTPRLLAAWLGSNEAFLTYREIAAGLRLRSQSHVSRLIRESEQAIGADPNLQRCIDRCISTIRGNQGKW